MLRHSIRASPALSENEFDIAGALIPENDINSLSEKQKISVPGTKHDFGLGENLESSGDENGESDEAFIAARQAASNKLLNIGKSKQSKKIGAFQSMGLNPALLKSISRKGFSVPTPIQRKTIPLILDNQDVVGMARTGSGKTAAFVIPMIDKLKVHSITVGARALVMSPSRELALQTMKAVKEFGRGTDLRTILLVGGDNLEDQFKQMSNNPDIIIATPGRFLHLLIEMSLELSSIRYVVFDEADRLFEMGFAAQLAEILRSLPASRQTLLFSATLPTNLVEFAHAGLREPNLVRLDAESKISADLQSVFLTVKPTEKESALLHILHDLISLPQDSNAPIKTAGDMANKKRKRDEAASRKSSQDTPTSYSTIIFTATKHHVEYLAALLHLSGFNVSYVYGSLDQAARRSQVELFRNGDTKILIVTDVAARGIDIPLLANVINYDFPSQPKIFVHRVGRTARAGGKGWSYSLVQDADIPYLLDLQLFLSRKLVIGRNQGAQSNYAEDIVVGRIPRSRLEKHTDLVTKVTEEDDEISGLKSVALKGEKLYTRTRNAASLQSAKRSKQTSELDEFQESNSIYGEEDTNHSERDHMLARISSFRPLETVFEIQRHKGSANSEAAKAAEAMRSKIKKTKLKRDSLEAGQGPNSAARDPTNAKEILSSKEKGSIGDLEDDVSDGDLEITSSNLRTMPKASETGEWQDAANFMSYEPLRTNLAEERGYGVQSGANQSNNGQNFMDAARQITLDLNNDESKSFATVSRPRQMRWDKRSKKYVARANDEDGSRGTKMVTGESGQKIPASFRSGRFEAWMKTNRMGRLPKIGEKESSAQRNGATEATKRFKHHSLSAPKQPDKYRDDYYKRKKKLQSVKPNDAGVSDLVHTRSELKGIDDVRKQRRVKQNRREKNARPPRKKALR